MLSQEGSAFTSRLLAGWRFKATEKILVNRVLLGPIRGNIKYPKGLSSLADRQPLLTLSAVVELKDLDLVCLL